MKQDGAERILTTANTGVLLRRPTLPSSRGQARAETMESPRSHPAASAATVDRKLARQLVLDELFDLSLYQSLRPLANDELRAILDRLIPIEKQHFAFWQDFFDLHVETLDLVRRLK